MAVISIHVHTSVKIVWRQTPPCMCAYHCCTCVLYTQHTHTHTHTHTHNYTHTHHTHYTHTTPHTHYTHTTPHTHTTHTHTTHTHTTHTTHTHTHHTLHTHTPHTHYTLKEHTHIFTNLLLCPFQKCCSESVLLPVPCNNQSLTYVYCPRCVPCYSGWETTLAKGVQLAGGFGFVFGLTQVTFL